MRKIFLALLVIFSALSFFVDKAAVLAVGNLKNSLVTNGLLLFSYPPFLVFLFFVIPSIILWKKKRGQILLLLSTFISTATLVFLLKWIIERARPYESFDIIPLTQESTSSMPSGHAALVFAAMPLLFKNFKKTRFAFLGFALITSFSRLYLGVHYASDVMVGITLGIFIGELFLFLEERRKIFKALSIMVKRWY